MTILILTAMPEEAEPIIKRYGLSQQLSKINNEPIYDNTGRQASYAGKKSDKKGDERIELLVSGPLEHNIVSLTAQHVNGRHDKLHVVNFGSCGGIKKSGVNIGETYFVDQVKKWDQHIPFEGYEWEQRDIELEVPKGVKGKVCLTGSRFVEDASKLPKGHLIDMELYGLASLCKGLNLPLTAIKYVTDYADQNSTQDFQKNVNDFRNKAVDRLEEVIPKLIKKM
jgi:adenosylhomocysteine nucleosidase